MIETKSAYLVHYPYAGGYYDQPWRTMEILNIILAEYRTVIASKIQSPV